MQKRFVEIRSLLDRALSPEDGQMLFLSDVSTLRDVCGGVGSDPVVALNRISTAYGVAAHVQDLDAPLWQLVDRLPSPG